MSGSTSKMLAIGNVDVGDLDWSLICADVPPKNTSSLTTHSQRQITIRERCRDMRARAERRDHSPRPNHNSPDRSSCGTEVGHGSRSSQEVAAGGRSGNFRRRHSRSPQSTGASSEQNPELERRAAITQNISNGDTTGAAVGAVEGDANVQDFANQWDDRLHHNPWKEPDCEAPPGGQAGTNPGQEPDHTRSWPHTDAWQEELEETDRQDGAREALEGDLLAGQQSTSLNERLKALAEMVQSLVAHASRFDQDARAVDDMVAGVANLESLVQVGDVEAVERSLRNLEQCTERLRIFTARVDASDWPRNCPSINKLEDQLCAIRSALDTRPLLESTSQTVKEILTEARVTSTGIRSVQDGIREMGLQLRHLVAPDSIPALMEKTAAALIKTAAELACAKSERKNLGSTLQAWMRAQSRGNGSPLSSLDSTPLPSPATPSSRESASPRTPEAAAADSETKLGFVRGPCEDEASEQWELLRKERDECPRPSLSTPTSGEEWEAEEKLEESDADSLTSAEMEQLEWMQRANEQLPRPWRA